MPNPRPTKRLTTVRSLAMAGKHSVEMLSRRLRKPAEEVRKVFDALIEKEEFYLVKTSKGIFLRKKQIRNPEAKKNPAKQAISYEKLSVAFRRKQIIDLAMAGKKFEEVFEEIFKSDSSKKTSFLRTLNHLIALSFGKTKISLEKLLESYEDYQRKMRFEKDQKSVRKRIEKQEKIEVQERTGNLDPLIKRFYEFKLNPRNEIRIKSALVKIGLNGERLSKFATVGIEAYKFFIFGKSEIISRQERGATMDEINRIIFVFDRFATQHRLPTIATYSKASELSLGKKFGTILEVNKQLFMAGTQILFLPEQP